MCTTHGGILLWILSWVQLLFSGISDADYLFVTDVVQKALIEVNEEGSEAAAATMAAVSNKMMVRNPRFICNKPFLFSIKDTLTGLILFSGRVADPTKN